MDSDKVKTFAIDNGFDLAGITGPEGLNLSPEFEWVKRIIILGALTPDPTIDASLNPDLDSRRRWSKWIYDFIEARSSRLALKLNEDGCRALPTKQVDLVGAAEKCGLGSRGLNNMLLTPEYGPRVRLIAIFTDARLETDKPFTKNLCIKCDKCFKDCPSGALTDQNFDRSKCPVGSGLTFAEAIDLSPDLKQFSENSYITCRICMDSCPVGE